MPGSRRGAQYAPASAAFMTLRQLSVTWRRGGGQVKSWFEGLERSSWISF